MTQDKNYLTLVHLSQLSFFVLPYFASILMPLVLWVLKKDQITDLDYHAKKVLNFQISMMIYTMTSMILIVFLYTFWFLILFAILYVLVPVLNAIRVSKGNDIYYPLTINFVK